MKKLTAGLVCLLAFGFASTTTAARPGKANILHCGCAAWPDGTAGMAYVPIEVSTKAKGHTKHAPGTIDTCYDGVREEYVDVTRGAADCQVIISEDDPLLRGLDACGAQDAFASCEQVIAQ